MDLSYRTFFGFQKEPFGADLEMGEILKTPELVAVKERFDYTIRIGAMALLTGEIGSGKSTALRYAIGQLHPSEYNPLYVTASSGSILELYRQILTELGIDTATSSRAVLLRLLRKEIQEIVMGKKMKALLIVDEASLMRLDVFAELHTICQFQQDSKPYLPLILAGQNNLVDKLLYRDSQPLASRVVARSHLDGVKRETCKTTSATTSPSPASTKTSSIKTPSRLSNKHPGASSAKLIILPEGPSSLQLSYNPLPSTQNMSESPPLKFSDHQRARNASRSIQNETLHPSPK